MNEHYQHNPCVDYHCQLVDSAAQTAGHRATRAGKPHLQDKLVQVEIEVFEVQQILSDLDLQAFIGTVSQEPDF